MGPRAHAVHQQDIPTPAPTPHRCPLLLLSKLHSSHTPPLHSAHRLSERIHRLEHPMSPRAHAAHQQDLPTPATNPHRCPRPLLSKLHLPHAHLTHTLHQRMAWLPRLVHRTSPRTHAVHQQDISPPTTAPPRCPRLPLPKILRPSIVIHPTRLQVSNGNVPKILSLSNLGRLLLSLTTHRDRPRFTGLPSPPTR